MRNVRQCSTFICSCSRSFTYVRLLMFPFVYSCSFAYVLVRVLTFVCSRSFSFVPFRCNVRLLTQYVTFVYSRSFTLVLSIRKERYSDQRFESHVRLQKPVTITRSFANVNLHTCSRDRTITLVYYLEKSSSQQ